MENKKNVLVHIFFKDACEVHAHACYKRGSLHANEEKTCCILMVLNSEMTLFTENLMVIDGNFIEQGDNILAKKALRMTHLAITLFHSHHNRNNIPFFLISLSQLATFNIIQFFPVSYNKAETNRI